MAQIPSARNFSNCYQRISANELTSVFNDADSAVVQMILQQLCHVQIQAGIQHRFHLILESQVNQTRDASPCSYVIFERPAKVNTRVLFSPTLSPSATCRFERSRLETLIRSLNDISYHAMPPPTFPSTQTMARQQPQQGTYNSVPFLGIQNPAPLSLEEEQIRRVGTIRVPRWFPYLGTEYTKPPQFSDEKLVIDPAIARRFHALNNDDISLLYRVFFEFLHCHARKKNDKYKQNMLKYSMFTPPWLRRQFIVGNVVVLMPKVVVPDQRENRNKMGYKRMALILSGFYMNEPYFGKFVLEYLLGRLPSIRREAERRRQARHAPLTEFDHTRTEKRLRPEQQFSRQVKTRCDATPDSDTFQQQQTTNGTEAGNRRPGNTGGEKGDDDRTASSSGEKNGSAKTGSMLPSGSPTFATPTATAPRVQQSRRVPLLPRKPAPRPGSVRPSPGKPSSRSPGGPRGNDKFDANTSSHSHSASSTEDSGQLEPTSVGQKTQDHAKAPRVTCGAGSNCMFAKDPNCQEVDAITGKCRNCDHPLHDLCGGGEEGDMLCISCTQ